MLLDQEQEEKKLSNPQKDTHIDIKKLNMLIGLTRILHVLCVIIILILLLIILISWIATILFYLHAH
ncbi:MAG: hypothetical protein FJX00_00125 [Alphaproteobacteria bacterium]|nr:hypothetical protein [Alphaproteobacteria bacterium]